VLSQKYIFLGKDITHLNEQEKAVARKIISNWKHDEGGIPLYTKKEEQEMLDYLQPRFLGDDK